jgi:cytochrome d ubiquinol oxidase subunit I
MKNDWEIKIPWVMGLIGTRSSASRFPASRDQGKNRERIISGIEAVQRWKPAQEPRRRRRGQGAL